MTVVSDAGPLIALARIGALNLLPGVYGDIVIPVAVRDEIRKPDRKRSGTVSFANADWLRTESVSNQSTRMLLHDNLDAGEREAIALAIELEAGVLLIDEALGRRVADSHGLTITGTLGVLLLAKEEDLIEAVAPAVDRLVSTGFRIGDALSLPIHSRADGRVVVSALGTSLPADQEPSASAFIPRLSHPSTSGLRTGRNGGRPSCPAGPPYRARPKATGQPRGS